MKEEARPYLEIETLTPDISLETGTDGIVYLESRVPLQPHPGRATERLYEWAQKTPDRIFLGQSAQEGSWETITYLEAWQKVQSIAQYLLNSGVSTERPIVILSGNSIEHGLLALAAMHVGIPYSPVSPAYSLKSSDFAKLKHCISLLTPGLVFARDGAEFEKAIAASSVKTPILSVTNLLPGSIDFDEISATPVRAEVNLAHQRVEADAIAKILFTSGSTGLPKGVINTHRNLCTNWQQITQVFPFMQNGGLNLIDWLPWNHTFGGNHNFGLTLYNGGSLYIDGGNPTPAGILKTVNNLRVIAPTVYFNVPKGFEELIQYLHADKNLCQHFFSQLKMFFYAGASMPQHVWDGLEELAYDATGKRLLIATGLGMTEASPSAMFNTQPGSRAGMLGVPVPGLSVKLVPDEEKMEIRFKGNNITPGYWRYPEATVMAFDEEGFYKTGDAVKLVDPVDPNQGFIFDGRIAEDFKLSTGTWVNAGVLRSQLIKAGNGLIKDAVITGHDRNYVGAIIFPELNSCRKVAGLPNESSLADLVSDLKVRKSLQEVLDALAKESRGSSTLIRKALFADFEPSLDLGEITDKGSINQRAVLRNRDDQVRKLYQNETTNVFESNPLTNG